VNVLGIRKEWKRVKLLKYFQLHVFEWKFSSKIYETSSITPHSFENSAAMWVDKKVHDNALKWTNMINDSSWNESWTVGFVNIMFVISLSTLWCLSIVITLFLHKSTHICDWSPFDCHVCLSFMSQWAFFNRQTLKMSLED
jgi:hypothetical protein